MVFDSWEIEWVVELFFGLGKILVDVEKVCDVVYVFYQQVGYQLVYVELFEQQVSGGVVLLKVQQMLIGQLCVVGICYELFECICECVLVLVEGKVLDFDQVQKELIVLNEGGCCQVMLLVCEGQVLGMMDVDLQVEEKLLWCVSVLFNNDYSVDIEKLCLSVLLVYDNLWKCGYSVNIGVYLVLEDMKQVKVFFVLYIMLFEGMLWSLEVFGYRFDSCVLNVGGQVGIGIGINVIGNGYLIGFKFNYCLFGSS